MELFLGLFLGIASRISPDMSSGTPEEGLSPNLLSVLIEIPPILQRVLSLFSVFRSRFPGKINSRISPKVIF